MPRRIVLFDTNVYYELSEADASALRAQERGVGVVACASVLVTLELLAHLADETDPKFGACLKALRSLRAHVSLWSYGEQIPFFGTAKDALSREWFGRPDPALRALSDGLGDLVIRATTLGGATDDAVRDAWRHVRSFVDAGEHRFGGGIASLVAKFADVTDQDGAPLDNRGRAREQHAFHREHGMRYAAETLAMAIAARVGEQIAPEDLPRFADRVLEVMPLSVSFLRNELRRYTADGADPQKSGNANSVWDLEHCGHVSRVIVPVESHLLGVAKPLLVTREHRIRVAARDAHVEDLVLDLPVYRTALATSEFA